jgi:hypothetical protein
MAVGEEVQQMDYFNFAGECSGFVFQFTPCSASFVFVFEL